MTVTANTTSGGTPAVPPEDLVTVTIDGFQIKVPKGTLVIRAAELLGIQIPRFCDHPLLDPAGACRQCLVEIPDAGTGAPCPSRRRRAPSPSWRGWSSRPTSPRRWRRRHSAGSWSSC